VQLRGQVFEDIRFYDPKNFDGTDRRISTKLTFEVSAQRIAAASKAFANELRASGLSRGSSAATTANGNVDAADASDSTASFSGLAMWPKLLLDDGLLAHGDDSATSKRSEEPTCGES
jgi:hypothetical protein